MKRKLLVSMIFMIALIYTTGGMVNASGETEKNDWLSLGKEQYNAARTLFYQEGNINGAESALKKAGEFFSSVNEDNDRYYWLGQVALLKAKIRMDRDEEGAWRLLSESEEATRKALYANKKAAEPHLLLGEILWERRQKGFLSTVAYLPQAYLLLEKAVILNPKDHTAQSSLAEYYIEAPMILGGNPRRGIEILENLPTPGDRHEEFISAYRLGKAYALDGQKEKALASFQHSLSIYKKAPLVEEKISKLLAEEKESNFYISAFPILPLFYGSGTEIGGGVSLGYKKVYSYINGSYDLANNLFYYNFSSQLVFRRDFMAEIGYYRRKDMYHPGYIYQDGLGVQLLYYGLHNYLLLDVFKGEIGGDNDGSVPVNSLSVALKQPFYQDWGKLVGLYMVFTTGLAGEESYSIAHVKLPLRYYDYSGLVYFGYINQGEETNFYYTNPARGYGAGEEKGNYAVLLRLERSFPLFLYSKKPFLGMLQGVVFFDIGSVADEHTLNTTGLTWRKSAGAGLRARTPLMDFCLDLAVTEDLTVQPVLNFEFAMF